MHFRKVHDIRALMALLPASARGLLTDAEQGTVTSYAVVIRYPGESGEDEPTIGEAREAVKLARRVRAHARKVLGPVGRGQFR